MPGHGVGINIPQESFGFGAPDFQFGGGGGGGGDFDIGALLQLLGGGGGGGEFGLEKLTGLSGFLAGPFGGLATMAAGGLIGGIGSLIAGDGGRGKRLRTAQGSAESLANSEIDQGQLLQLMSLFDKSQGPRLKQLFGEAASRVGLDSGIGQAFALNRLQDDRAQFSTQSLLDAIRRVSQDRRVGARLQAGLVGG